MVRDWDRKQGKELGLKFPVQLAERLTGKSKAPVLTIEGAAEKNNRILPQVARSSYDRQVEAIRRPEWLGRW